MNPIITAYIIKYATTCGIIPVKARMLTDNTIEIVQPPYGYCRGKNWHKSHILAMARMKEIKQTHLSKLGFSQENTELMPE